MPTPPSGARKQIAVLEPTGEIFVNGLASWYEDDFPASLSCSAYMTQDEFTSAITKINEALLDHWPCMPCTSFAYGCCICTLGLSFYCATGQVDEAEQRAQMQIRRINDQANFKAKGIEWKLVRVWYTRKSHIEITVADTKTATIAAAAAVHANSSDATAPLRSDASVQEAPGNQEMRDRVV